MATRDETLYVRVSKSEKAAMTKRAEACGLSLAGWSRSVLRFVSTGEGVPPGFDTELARELGLEKPRKRSRR
jgi:hypothetical protein